MPGNIIINIVTGKIDTYKIQFTEYIKILAKMGIIDNPMAIKDLK